MLLHALDSANKGHRRIMLRTVDTDVLVLAVSTAVCLADTEIWVAFGTGKYLRYIPAHDIAKELRYEKALPMFHAFTGCDTVSSFAGRGKKTAFDIWKSFDEVTPVFSSLLTDPSTFNDDCMSVLGWRHMLYFCTTAHARKQPLTQPGRTYSPPKTGQWTTYHQQKQPCYSTQNGQYTKVDMYRRRHLSVVR
ncbi:hypothetical protein PoB_003881100 [Plakobranchus ocellatus]|uniref:Uncharacterized protein n=1 Tax=Plakobranchus ocellatus TaxID=259542 RepID=A0AAV4AVW0_9GAST|nr:hypothetical protein PoB_003881100 [Plakobranchus ocellatus]